MLRHESKLSEYWYVNNQNPISITCIQETWGHEDSHMDYFSLHNYTLVNANRRLTTHGGLIIYIHNDFKFKELNGKLPITHTSNMNLLPSWYYIYVNK